MSAKHRVSGIATAALVAGRLFHLAPLQDAVTGKSIADIATLHFPAWHIILTPLSVLADFITFNSARQDVALIIYLILAYWVYKVSQWKARKPHWTDIGDYIVYLACVLGFLTWAMLLPRPAAKLETSPTDYLMIPYWPHADIPNPSGPIFDRLPLDFHSHTSYSWDGRRVLGEFTPEKNILWHEKMGFMAGFVTDHNVIEGAREAQRLTRLRWPQASTKPFFSQSTPYRSLVGEEVSLHDTHIVVLGNSKLIDNSPYNNDGEGVFRFLKEEPEKFGGLTVMSLPEYWKGHPESRWEEFAAAGAAGFEIVNSAPRAMDFPQALREKVIDLCRKRNLFVTGVSDTHGWGSAAFVWNLIYVPGESQMDPVALQRAVLQTLRRDGFKAVQVVQRTKQAPLPFPVIALDPILMLWMMCRTFNWIQTLVCAAWIWGIAALTI